jgi:REP element-mobilizing transposase RayT
MHLTVRVCDDVPGLRRPEVRDYLRELVEAARARGVSSCVVVLMHNHLHWIVTPRSAAALRDATRFVFGHLARFLNRLFGRVGKVFVERYFSTCCRNVRKAYHALNYVLKNPAAAGYRVVGREGDAYSAVFEEELAADPFLRAGVGPTPGLRRALLARMAQGRVAFVPLAERVQPRLPGL